MKTTNTDYVLALLEHHYSVTAQYDGVSYHVQEYCEGSFQLFNKHYPLTWAKVKEIDFFNVPKYNTRTDDEPKPKENC